MYQQERLEDILESVASYRQGLEKSIYSSFSLHAATPGMGGGNGNGGFGGSGYGGSGGDAAAKAKLQHSQLQLQSKMIVNNKNSKDIVEFSKLRDSNILIAAFSMFNRSCWPLGLIGNFVEMGVDLNDLDYHGGLWRMIRRPDAYPGTRIILQTSELSEETLFLCPDLKLSKSIDSAAVWSIYTVNPGAVDGKETFHEGRLVVKLELFEGQAKRETRYLVSLISSINTQDSDKMDHLVDKEFEGMGIALLSESEIRNQESLGNIKIGILWEIIQENSDVRPIDFQVEDD